jgi:glycosyltransferase involved in cell wall biosynthesis
MYTVIIPACNEENYIGACLNALAAQEGLPEGHGIEVIVAANACRDATVQIAQAAEAGLRARGFRTQVLDITEPGKMNALNVAEAASTYPDRAYLDADVILSPPFLAEMAGVLTRTDPVYVGGTVRIPRPASWVSRAYARVWLGLPFVRCGVSGIGLYAMNAAGRARWGTFPKVYSDDRFVRLHFAPNERVKLSATYDWPLPEGFANMVKVRRRWCQGSDELRRLFPELQNNDSQRNGVFANLLSLLRHPFSAAVFVTIFALGWAMAKFHRPDAPFHWSRGRR